MKNVISYVKEVNDYASLQSVTFFLDIKISSSSVLYRPVCLLCWENIAVTSMESW